MFYKAAVCLLAAAHYFAAEVPLSIHDLVAVESAGDAVIRLKGYDLDGDKLSYSILSGPTSGKLFQLSQVYSKHGYDPKAGVHITSGPVSVTGSRNRVYYSRPTPDSASNSKWGSFEYTVSDGRTESKVGHVTLVPPTGALVGSSFFLNNEGWTVVGNTASSASAVFEPYNRGSLLSRYISATDDKLSVESDGRNDEALWFFKAPSSYHGNHGIAYGGHMSFTMAAFSGDFNNINDQANLIELECAECVGPVNRGIKLVYPLSLALQSTPFTGAATNFRVKLLESSGWLKDPQNTLLEWEAPSQCDMIQTLSRLSSVKILGDFSKWFETMALDDVIISNLKAQIPVCAMHRSDASVCTCDSE